MEYSVQEKGSDGWHATILPHGDLCMFPYMHGLVFSAHYIQLQVCMCAVPVSQNYASPRIVRPAGLVVLRYWVPIRIGCPNRGAVEASTAEKSAQEKLHYQDVLKYLTERSYRAEAEKAIMEEDDPKESERFHSQRWSVVS